MSGTNINQVILDLNLSDVLSDLTPQERTNFTNNLIDQTVTNVDNSFTDSYSFNGKNLVSSDNNITSNAYYLTRTNDLHGLANDLDLKVKDQIFPAQINQGLLSRQAEINEWANSNKLDTLFFLQILFISLMIISILSYFLSIGLINSSLFTLLTFFIAFLATAVLIVRWRHTSISRDSRYWNKARFGIIPGTNTATSSKCS
jgi:hypothetical protein